MYIYPRSNPIYSAVLQDVTVRKWLGFSEPLEIIEASGLEQVLPVIRQVEDAAWQRGLWAVGFVCYEAAPAFDQALLTGSPAEGVPLAWFALYSGYTELCCMPGGRDAGVPTCNDAVEAETAYSSVGWKPAISRHQYHEAIRRIKHEIARGATYQVNYTYRLNASCTLSPWLLFQRIAAAQQADYAAYLDTGSLVVCSASPELFFTLDGRVIKSRPMKGTAPRGRFGVEDRAAAEWLRNSGKNRAENIMIVDMVRNDLGRIAEIGSVAVERLFDVERYPTVWQMTSTVTARTDAGLPEIFASLFPCASITGAPKASTMRIISELEEAARGIYTGAIGFVAPGRRAQFNVAIRTVVFDPGKSRVEYGVGGGITWDSDAEDEYEECGHKAQVLTRAPEDFALLESLLWEPERGYFLLEDHLLRLAESANYFGFTFVRDEVEGHLRRAARQLPACGHKVRLLLWRRGKIQVEALPLADVTGGPVRLAMAVEPVDAGDIFLFHKTTRRQVYTRAAAAKADCDDVVLFNEKGEITETTIANLVVEIDGQCLTPPIACGLLGGVMRAYLLRQGKIREAVIAREDLLAAERIWVINSVRGRRAAVLAGKT